MSYADPAAALASVFNLIWPEAILGLAACILFVGGTFRADRHLWGLLALVGLAVAGFAFGHSVEHVRTVEARQEVLEKWSQEVRMQPAGERRQQAELLEREQQHLRRTIFTSPVLFSRLAILIKGLALLAGVVLVLFNWNEVTDQSAADVHACLLLIVAGLSLAGSANELVLLFLSLELISIPTYVLLYLQRTDSAAQEAAVKYFLLSIFSSGLMLFGFSYLYGLTGTTNIPGLLDALNHARPTPPALTLVALVMVVAGLGFKITAVPFHFYAPDVYQGTSTAAAALLAFVPKVAGFVALFRLLDFLATPGASADWGPGWALGPQVPFLFWMLAAFTMTVGNVLALLQDNLKRMLAYSSVAHAGYMLIGLATAPHLYKEFRFQHGLTLGVEAILFYLIAYGAMTVGVFAVIAFLSRPDRPVETVDDLAGLSRSHPTVALLMALFLFSLIGMPGTAGFMGKVLLFMGAMQVPGETHTRHYLGLAFIGAINAAIGAWYYLRIVAVMYLRNPIKPLPPMQTRPGWIALWVCAAVTLLAGVAPQPVVRMVQHAVPVVPHGTPGAELRK